MKRIPGPKGLPWIGLLPERLLRPLEMYTRVSREYPDYVRIPLGFETIYLCNTKTGVARVLQNRSGNYIKGRNFAGIRRFMGNGLLVSEGQEWKKQRRIVAPAFHQDSIKLMRAVVDSAIDRLLERWQGKNEVLVYRSMTSLTLDIAATALLGKSVSPKVNREFAEDAQVLVDGANKWLMSLVKKPQWFLKITDRQYIRALERFDNNLKEVVVAKINKKDTSAQDCIDYFQKAYAAENDEPIDYQEIRNQAVSFLMAGHETTAAALSWIVWHLGQSEELQNDLLQEGLAQEFAGDFDAFPLTVSFIKEVLRLYPPGWIIARELLAEDEIDGYQLPKGAIVAVSPYLMHRDPRFWSAPETFQARRFIGFEPDRHVYFPFGLGPRLCIGKELAMSEMVMTIQRLVQKFRIQVANKPVAAAAVITLKPAHDFDAKLVLRH